ncbi:MAG: lipid kinase [Bacteroidetes bacterium GWD2_45_23]|nr:MAG: lipid kinase [Bacteroidetes bacterium GWC2_46_850]OFX75354.1 MAG: lipid kinase [Bacteroidetes bacterium GWC1_47_7]OFX84605.1 MAG: lipid kinase [Bacteroidetes bacterium GWD2_45_23]HAR38194.1 lipid kinase [Porphyromonadaceae bacterium]HBB00163.1 lipid kinase [Porphyromonadaceae bacterium]
MAKEKVCLIINPVSGTESKKNIPEDVAAAFDQKKVDLMIRVTGYPEHATEIARKAAKRKYRYVIAAGGDGTVNEVARALVNTSTTLGILPLGSGNGLARDLGIPMDAEKALGIILRGNTRTIDYGIANDHIFFCTCGFGFDAFVSDRFAEDKKRGPLGYVRNVLESVVDFRAEEYEITSDEGIIREKAFILTCANASQYGNDAFIAPGASMDDGKMNVSILKPLNALEIPQTTIQLFTKNIDKNSKMISLLTRNLHIKRARPGVMHIDGDPVKTDTEITVRMIHKGLNVLAPSLSDLVERKRKENENVFSALTRWFNE